MTTDHIPPPDPDGWALWIETLIGGRTPVAWYDDPADAISTAAAINTAAGMEPGSGWVEVRPMPRTAAANLHHIAELRNEVTA